MYLPDPWSLSGVTIETTQFSGLVPAEWADPADGVTASISGNRFSNTGMHAFAPTTNNSVGDKDWG